MFLWVASAAAAAGAAPAPAADTDIATAPALLIAAGDDPLRHTYRDRHSLSPLSAALSLSLVHVNIDRFHLSTPKPTVRPFKIQQFAPGQTVRSTDQVLTKLVYSTSWLLEFLFHFAMCGDYHI